MPDSPVDEIFQAFADRGADHYGENVSQIEHALQCAYLAVEEGAGDHLVAAALLHDFGHLFEARGEVAESEGRDARHEIHGARALGRWFGRDVTGPVALHVAAKRYLCATEPAYEEALSAASRLSLKLQGGPFTAEERLAFERSPFAADAVRLRRWDDTGKIPDLAVPPLEHYRPLLERLAAA
ncbi:MAG: HD domain-containing protein [Caulobacteraceae bacterium]|nr:HD domain-containing protein [Caulobacteraceae bacterium]